MTTTLTLTETQRGIMARAIGERLGALERLAANDIISKWGHVEPAADDVFAQAFEPADHDARIADLAAEYLEHHIVWGLIMGGDREPKTVNDVLAQFETRALNDLRNSYNRGEALAPQIAARVEADIRKHGWRG